MAEKIIDVHTHPANEKRKERAGDALEYAAEYFGTEITTEPIEETVQKFEDCDITTAVLFALDSETNRGIPRIENEWVAEICDEFDLYRGFASVDPHKGEIAIQEAKEAIETFELDGFKFAPNLQGFTPSNSKFDPLWETLEALGKPALFHGGYNGLGTGAPGGCGFLLKHSRPIHIDEVAANHPELPIVIAHPGWPWHSEQLAVVQHKGNVYMDLSGWRPKYIPDEVKQYTRSVITEKVMFGSDYPLMDPDVWLEDFEKWDLSAEARRKILYENAAELLGIE